MGAVRATKAEMARALEAWKGQGLPIGGMEILPDGTIRIIAPMDARKESPHDEGKPEPW